MIEVEKEGAKPIALSTPGKFLVLFAGVASAFAIVGLSPVLPAIAAHFADYPNAEMTTRLLISLIGVMAAIASPFAGIAADRFGLRRLMLVGQATYGIAGCLGFFVDNLYLLVVLRIFVGLGAAAIGSSMLALVAVSSTGATRNKWMGYTFTLGPLSTLVLLPLVGFLSGYGWRWPFLVHALALPLFLLAFVGLEKDHVRGVRAPKDRSAAAPRSPIPVVLLVIAVTSGIISSTPIMYVPFRLRDIGVTDAGLIGAAMLPVVCGAALFAFFYGWFRKRLSSAQTFVLGFTLAAVGLGVSATGTSFAYVLIGQTLLGISIGIFAPNVYALAAITGPDSHRAATMGFARGGMVGGPLFGQLGLEAIVKHSDAGFGLLVLCLFAALLAAAHGSRGFFRTAAAKASPPSQS